jgi:predicted RNA-binding Zn-ribbon protein involved in translation (DUF1610 family)
MGENIFFKVKSTKQNNPEGRSTLDAIHSQKMGQLNDERDKIPSFIRDIALLEARLSETTTDTEIWRLEQKIECLKKKIKQLENNDEIMDYYLRSGEILFDYYDVQEKIQQGHNMNKAPVRAKPGSILAILDNIVKKEDTDNGIVGRSAPECPINTVATAKPLQRNELLNKYLSIEDPSLMYQDEVITEDEWTYCELCNAEMTMCLNEAVLTCPSCGNQEHILIDSDKPSYKDPPREVAYYAYKKINHFNEWLAQFQAKESTDIPQEIYDQILIQLKKERITSMGALKPSKLREILRGMGKSKYYEHIPHIINRLNGQNAPFMSREDEEKLRHMFREIQPSFKKHMPKGRRNFLSYAYVLYKFCELLEMDEFLPCFTRLKNREKLIMQDKTWQKICEEMGWQFIRSC